MKNSIYILAVFFFLFSATNVFAQASQPLKISKVKKEFQISSKSGDLAIRAGATKKIEIKLKKHQQYFISVSSKKRNTDVHYRITNGDQIVYDNSLFEYSTQNLLCCNSEGQIKIEIFADPNHLALKKDKRLEVNFILAHKNINHYENTDFDNMPVYASN